MARALFMLPLPHRGTTPSPQNDETRPRQTRRDRQQRPSPLTLSPNQAIRLEVVSTDPTSDGFLRFDPR